MGATWLYFLSNNRSNWVWDEVECAPTLFEWAGFPLNRSPA